MVVCNEVTVLKFKFDTFINNVTAAEPIIDLYHYFKGEINGGDLGEMKALYLPL